ncbi:MAG: FHA domain-containing protein [Prevotella sp.]|nr:FHA domain-containing protein [Prevotella sp.]
MDDVKHLGEVKHVKDRMYSVKSTARVGCTYTLTCPVCGKTLTTTPSEEGVKHVSCDTDSCGVVIGYKAIRVTGVNVVSPQSKNGMLEWGGIISRNRYVLRLGKNVVGRKDKDMPSDVEIDDPDAYVSRQSFEIFVCVDDEGGYRFILSVKRLTNPLYLNGNQKIVGESMDLKFGDVIQVGSVKLKLKESKK